MNFSPFSFVLGVLFPPCLVSIKNTTLCVCSPFLFLLTSFGTRLSFLFHRLKKRNVIIVDEKFFLVVNFPCLSFCPYSVWLFLFFYFTLLCIFLFLNNFHPPFLLFLFRYLFLNSSPFLSFFPFSFPLFSFMLPLLFLSISVCLSIYMPIYLIIYLCLSFFVFLLFMRASTSKNFYDPL